MNNKEILILGSTGKLGCMLLKYCKKNHISIFAATCFTNKNLLNRQKKNYDIKKIFTLSNSTSKQIFIDLLKKKKFKIIYFLDYGSESLLYIDILMKMNTNSYFAIANKELLIAGGNILINNINASSMN